MKYRELQKALKAKGLKSHGTVADLKARLKESEGITVSFKVPTKKGFVYIGQGDSNPEYIGLYGYMFELNGDAVEVEEPFASNLRTNNHFKEV
jgi:hypothetical protein